jgi:hypothetical protein
MHYQYSHGYAVPDYVNAEPKIPRGGVFRTKYRRRRSYDDLSPGFSLGADDDGDPIAEFGQHVSRLVMSEVYKLPVNQRQAALKAAFDQLDPNLWDRVNARSAQLQAEFRSDPKTALAQAIADSASLGLLEQFAKAGKGRRVKPNSMLGITHYGARPALDGYQQALGGIGSSLSSFGSKIVNGVGSAACAVAGNPAGQIAAGVAGGPAAAGGAAVLAAKCGGGGGQQVVYAPPQRSSLLPFLLIGGALVVAAVILKGK